MRTVRTYYEILGLPRDATLAQVKRRYKQLVHKYHPDVAADKELAHRLFIQITEAYDVLGDPVRRKAYDANLAIQGARAAARATETEIPGDPRSESIARMLSDVRFAFINRRFSEAGALCKRALALDPHSARAHAMMGDIYRAQGKPAPAAKHYAYAVQYNPADRESNQKLMDLVGRQSSARPAGIGRPRDARASEPRRAEESSKSLIAVNILLFMLAAFLLIMISLNPGKPVSWLTTFFSPADQWSLNLAVLIAASSVVVGFLLAINRLVADPDEELIFEGGDNWAVVPAGLLLLLGSGLFFLASAAFYVVVGIAQGSLSKSVMTVFACVMAVVTVAALMYHEPAIKQVLLFGGNVSFIPMLIGWYLGAAARPLNRL